MWACEAQIPRGAHRIQEGANAPLPPLNEYIYCRIHSSVNVLSTVNLKQKLLRGLRADK